MNITAGIYKGRKIKAPDEKIARPTLSKVRMGVFNTLYSIIGDFEGKSFLDVFGGSGIMGLEAISRGFSNVTVFEKNKIAAEIIKLNYATLNIKPDLRIGDSYNFIKTAGKYDVIYIDPPYESDIYQRILRYLQGEIIIVEHDKELEFNNYEIIKSKNYGGKYVTYLRNKS